MGAALAAAGLQTAGKLFDVGMGLLMEGHQDRRQRRQAEKLQNIQIKGQKEMTDYNMAKQLQMWEATGYGAQKKQMEEAGLNPALMYGMSGGGGQTANVNTGSVSGQSAAQAESFMGLAMMKAQIENLKAQTDKTKAETSNVGKTGENIEASTDLVKQNIKNAAAQEEYTKSLTAFQQLETNFANDTYKARSAQIEKQLEQTIETVKQIGLANKFTQQTWNDAAHQIGQNALGAELQNELLRVQKTAAEKGIQLTTEQIAKIKADIQQGWKKLDIEVLAGERDTYKMLQADIDLALKEMQTKFNITHPGLWNVVGGTVEKTIKETVEDIKRNLGRLIPKL